MKVKVNLLFCALAFAPLAFSLGGCASSGVKNPSGVPVTEMKAAGASADAYTRDRLGDMLNFFELTTSWCEQTRKMPTSAVIKMCKVGDKIVKLLGIG